MSDAVVGDAPRDASPEVRNIVRAIEQFLENVREGVVFVDNDLQVAYLNAVARRDFGTRGVEPGRYLGRSLWELLGYPADLPSRVAVEQAVRDRLPTFMTSKGLYGDYWIEMDIIPVDHGVALYYRDVTPRTVAEVARAASETALQLTNERLRVLIDEAPLAIMVLDTEARVQHWNPAAEAMFLWPAADVLGNQLPTVPGDERATYDWIMARVRAGESVRAYPTRRIRRDGAMLDVQISASPMRDHHGAVIGTIVMTMDVTTNRKLEAQLRMAQKMEAVGLLAGGVAHDFNNLLTAIKGFTSLLEMSLEANEQNTEFLGEINKAADRAASLTAQLLAFSRRQLLRPEPIDLNARVRELERMLRLLLREDGQLVLALDSNLSRVLADPGQIEQVILNLVVNARDAIHERPDGRVTITTSNAELKDEFALWGVEDAAGHYVRLDVADNGVGMDRKTMARIFDPFFTTKEAGRGTGLGLATVFGIVKQSGGYVWADSAPGEGATFSVYLPRTRSRGRVSGPANVVESSGGEQILLVEDESAVRRVARRALELQGYTVLEAGDGQAALEIARAHEIDLLLTDVMMPGILGTSLAERLRVTDPDLPVLFMSGHTDGIVGDGLLDPDTPFIGKPFTPAQLAQRVREALDKVK